MKVLGQIIAKWLGESVQELPPETAAKISAAFESVGGTATSDLVALYAEIGGMQMMDNDYFRLWPLAEIQEENSNPSTCGVLFADYLLNSWCYRVKPASHDQSQVYVDFFDGNAPTLVAESLIEFLKSCVNDPEAVLHHPVRPDATA